MRRRPEAPEGRRGWRRSGSRGLRRGRGGVGAGTAAPAPVRPRGPRRDRRRARRRPEPEPPRHGPPDRGVPHRGHSGGSTARGELHPALDAVQPGHERALVAVRGRQQHARADQLQLEPGRGGAAHLGEALVDDVGGAAELGGTERAGLRLHAFEDVGGGVDEALVGGVGDGGEDDEVAQPLQQVGDEAARVVAPSITRSTTSKAAAPSPVAKASTTESSSEPSV